MQDEYKEYLLDTNCFYSIGRNQAKIEKIRRLSCKFTTSSIAVSEIQRIKNFEDIRDFGRRQAAMFALENITDEIYVTPGLTVIPKAYGQPFDKNVRYARESIQNFLNAKAPREIYEAINDNINNWKENWQTYYSQFYKKVLDYPPENEEKLRTELIIAYACQAELFSKQTFEQAKSDNILFQEIEKLALDKYTGQLDFLISFLVKMNQINYRNRNKKLDENRLFDLEFLFNMRPNDSNQIFVTIEKDLIEIFQGVDSKRIIHFDRLL